jgi:hypothetical protein
VLHRTDDSVEAVADFVLQSALDTSLDPSLRPARRCAVVRTAAATTRTTLLVVRYRVHLQLPARSGTKQLDAEDVATLAFEGAPASATWLDEQTIRELTQATADANVAPDQAHDFIERALAGLDALTPHLDERGDTLADQLRDSHRRVRAVTGEVRRGLTVTAQKPADVLGVYIYLPTTGSAQ